VAWNLRNDTFFFMTHEHTVTNNAIVGELLVVKSLTMHSSVQQLGIPMTSRQTTHLRTDVMRRTKTSELTHPNFLWRDIRTPTQPFT